MPTCFRVTCTRKAVARHATSPAPAAPALARAAAPARPSAAPRSAPAGARPAAPSGGPRSGTGPPEEDRPRTRRMGQGRRERRFAFQPCFPPAAMIATYTTQLMGPWPQTTTTAASALSQPARLQVGHGLGALLALAVVAERVVQSELRAAHRHGRQPHALVVQRCDETDQDVVLLEQQGGAAGLDGACEGPGRRLSAGAVQLASAAVAPPAPALPAPSPLPPA